MISVQETLEDKLSSILKVYTRIHGCGRTDKGVHAQKFYAHFNSLIQLDNSLIFKLNKQLPNDIRAKKLIQVEPKAHAQFDATSRTYIYRIHSTPDPLINELSYYLDLSTINISLLSKAMDSLMTIQEYYSVCLRPNSYKHTRCIFSNVSASHDKVKNLLSLKFTANRFLHSMIRLLVARLLDISVGKMSLDQFLSTMQRKEKFKFYDKAPPQGLHLIDIQYPYL